MSDVNEPLRPNLPRRFRPTARGLFFVLLNGVVGVVNGGIIYAAVVDGRLWQAVFHGFLAVVASLGVVYSLAELFPPTLSPPNRLVLTWMSLWAQVFAPYHPVPDTPREEIAAAARARVYALVDTITASDRQTMMRVAEWCSRHEVHPASISFAPDHVTEFVARWEARTVEVAAAR